MLLSDKTIADLVKAKQMINPFSADSVSQKADGTPICSSGASSYGYDLSFGRVIRRLKSAQQLRSEGHNTDEITLVIDPSNFNPVFYTEPEVLASGICVLMPGEKILGVSLEHVNMPGHISAICMQKSTIARAWCWVEVTPLEAGWSGYVTLEICNPTDSPLILHVGQGITQALFFEGDKPCSTTYLDRGGKYQNQPAIPIIPRSKAEQVTGYPYLLSKGGIHSLQFFPLQQETAEAVVQEQPVAETASGEPSEKNTLIGFLQAALQIATSEGKEDSVKALNEQIFQEHLRDQMAATKAWYESAPADISIADAIKVIAKAVHTDQSYAWTWICNLAMMAKDAGASNVSSNKGASNLMYNLFKYRAWAVNDTFKSHIEDAERDTRLSKDDTELVFSPANVDPTFTNEGFRQEMGAGAMKELITHTRASGFTTGAKPGSAAARLGILPVQDQSVVGDKPTEVEEASNSIVFYISAENMEEQLPQICRKMEMVRDGKLVAVVIQKQK